MKRTICALMAALMLLTALPAHAAEGTGVEVFGSNGTITAGVDADRAPVWSTDGVHWQAGQADEGWYCTSGYYAGGEFWACQRNYSGDEVAYRSDDGIHWQPLGHDEPVTGWPIGAAELGPYRFEVGWSSDSVWVMPSQGNSGLSAELTYFSLTMEKYREKSPYAEYMDVKAYYGPGETVTVEASVSMGGEGEPKVAASFTTDSLDWVLEHQATFRMWDPERTATDGRVTLRQRSAGGSEWDFNAVIEYSYDANHYAVVPNAPWGGRARLMPYDGRTFLVLDQDRADAFVSTDGVHWTSLRGTYLRPALPEGVEAYATGVSLRMQWTGEEYITCQRYAEGHSGMMGVHGGQWYDPNGSKVSFCNADFHLTSSHDFGRQVVGVGRYNGAWYAEVSNSAGMSVDDYDADAGTTLYVSRDKVNWEATDIIQIMSAVQRF